jgi:large subunit ribosomal protein L3
MGVINKPRSGSMAYYPRVRAKKHTPSFSSFELNNEVEVSPVNFLGYKAGMTTVFALNQQQKSPKYNIEVPVPATVIECPPIKVFGLRAYTKTSSGKKVLMDVLVEKIDKEMLKKIHSFLKSKKDNKKSKKTVSDLEKAKEDISEIRLIAFSQPKLTGIGKKKPDLFEVALNGSVEKQLIFGKEKLGKEIKASEVFKERIQVDVKAVDKGKGFQGVVKRFGVKIHRPKAKKHRYVGSISPWTPATVMWTVPRAGQLGYQNRTEFNKMILFISEDVSKINPKAGFKKYGLVKNEFLLITGSVPGAIKRPIAIRNAIRANEKTKPKLSEITGFSHLIEETKEGVKA